MQSSNAPSWLFSFVDLSLLLLIGLVHLESASPSRQPDFGELAVPRIETSNADLLEAEAEQLWQVRVHPPTVLPDGALQAGAFQVVRSGRDGENQPEPARLGRRQLRDRLVQLQAGSATRPLLAPHERSRSGDMLAALNAIEEVWPGARRATIAPVSAGP